MKKRFVLSGYFGFKNFGDEAILSVLVNKLQQEKHRITVISSDTAYTKNKFKHIRSVYTFNIGDIIGAIYKSDYLISGGGSLLQDTTSLKSLIYYLFIIFIAIVLRKKVIIFAQGIGPISSPIGTFLTKNILKYCKYLSVRDIKSYELLKNWGIKADLLCDPIFSTAINPSANEDSVAVQLRDFKTMSEDFIDRLAQKVAKEFPDKHIKIYPFQSSIDNTVCQNFERAIKLLNSDIKTTLYYDLTDEEIIDGISNCQYLIAMRFHAIIIGLIAGVKTLAINYDIKVEKLATEFELPILNLNTEFEKQFEELKKQQIEKNLAKVKLKNFDWTGFDRAIL